MVKIKDLRNMPKDELQKHMTDMKMELIKSYAQVSSGTPSKNPGQIRQMKKTIARIKTITKQGGRKKA